MEANSIEAGPKSHIIRRGAILACEICGVICDVSNIKRHRNIHSEKKFKCRYCTWEFSRKDSSAVHMIGHLRNRIGGFECPVEFCELKFNSYTDTLKHLKRVHDITPTNEGTCKVCSRKCKMAKHLLRHFLVEHDEGSAIDNGLEAVFNTMEEPDIEEENMEEANMKEPGIEELSPEEPNEAVSVMGESGIEESITKEPNVAKPVLQKPRVEEPSVESDSVGPMRKGNLFKCEGCGLSLSRSSLYRHKNFSCKQHHKCPYCKNEYVRIDMMKQHMLQHVKNRVGGFECPQKFCEMHFETYREVSRHLKTHGIRPYHKGLCKKCLRTCDNPVTLLHHFFIEHQKRHTVDDILNKKTNEEPAKTLPSLLNPPSVSYYDLLLTISNAITSKTIPLTSSASFDPSSFVANMMKLSIPPILKPVVPQQLSLTTILNPTSSSFPEVSKIPCSEALVSIVYDLTKKESMPCNTANAQDSASEGTSSSSNPPIVELTESDDICNHCGRQFDDEEMFYTHKVIHSDRNRLRCAACGYQSKDKDDYYSHVFSINHCNRK